MEENNVVTPEPKKTNIALVIGLTFVIFALIVAAVWLVRRPSEYSQTTTQETPKKGYEIAIDKVAGLIDAGEIDSITAKPSLNGKAVGMGEKAYSVISERCNGLICYVKNDRVILATYDGRDYYKNAKALAKVSNYTFTLDEMTDYQEMTIDSIKGALTNPGGAVFSSSLADWSFKREEPKATVKSFVDVTGKDGKTNRYDFTVKFQNKSPKSIKIEDAK